MGIDEKTISDVQQKINEFNTMCADFVKLENEVEQTRNKKAEIEQKLQGIRGWDEQLKEFYRIILKKEEEKTEADVLDNEIANLEQKIEELQQQKDNLQERILESLSGLPFPLDPKKMEEEEGLFKVRMIEGVNIDKDSYDVIRKILDISEYPLKIESVIAETEVWKVDASSREEALSRVLSAIKTIWEKANFRRKVFDEIDGFCERIHGSNRYKPVMIQLTDGKTNPTEIAKEIGLEERVVYDTCYNLSREKLWNPPLVKPDRGTFHVTSFGDMVMQRYRDKYPEDFEEKKEGARVTSKEPLTLNRFRKGDEESE